MADDRCKCENRYKNKFQYLKRFTTKISFWCQRIVTKVMSQLSPIFIIILRVLSTHPKH